MKKHYTTAQLAALTSYHVGSVYRLFAENGHFYGVTPIKTMNGRLQWPAEAVDAMLEAQGASHD